MFPLNPAGFLPDLRRLRLRALTGVWGDGGWRSGGGGGHNTVAGAAAG